MFAFPGSEKRLKFYVNKTFFYSAMIFISLGFIGATLLDFSRGYRFLLGADFIGLLIFSLTISLLYHHFISANTALLVNILTTLTLYYTGFIWIQFSPEPLPFIWVEYLLNLLIGGALAAACGLILSRNSVYVISFMTLVLVVSLWFMPQVEPLATRYAFPLILFAALIFSVYHFRTAFEKILKESNELIDATGLIKERLEKKNEMDRSFVYFGQNSVSLVQDFELDIGRLQQNLKILQLGDSSTEDCEIILKHMQDQARALSKRIDMVTFVTSAGPDRKVEHLIIHQVFESALYPLRINASLKAWCRLDFECNMQIDTWDYRYNWLRLIEYILRQVFQDPEASPLNLKFLITANTDFIRLAYCESRPVFFLEPQDDLRQYLQKDNLSVVKELLNQMGGELEQASKDKLDMIIQIPRKLESGS